MQLQPNSSSRLETLDAGQTDAGIPESAPIAPSAAPEPSDPTLRLLKGCVEAMSLLQAKCESLEAELNLKIDVAARERTDLRHSLAAAEAAMAEATHRMQDSDERLGRVEAAAQDSARQFADDLAVARQEAANWRMRSETDAMAFEHLNSRLTAIEAGLSAKLEVANVALAEQTSTNAELRVQAESDAAKSIRLETQLRSVEATIADQRSRISCLQSKLATATYAIRLEHMSRGVGSDAPAEREILDLHSLARAV